MRANIRQAQEGDLEQLAGLISRAQRRYVAFELPHLARLAREGKVLCVERAGRLEAFLYAVLDRPNCHLRGLILPGGNAAKELLSLLLAELIRRAKQLGAASILVLASAAWLRQALLAHGFGLSTELVTLRRRLPVPPLYPWPAIELHSATEADLEALLVIEEEAFPPAWRNGPNTTAEYLWQMPHFLLARSGREPIGYICAQERARAAHIVRIAVRPRYQRRGVGKALLAALASALEAKGVRSLTLNTQAENAAALGFYRALGFAPEGARTPLYRLNLAGNGP